MPTVGIFELVVLDWVKVQTSGVPVPAAPVVPPPPDVPAAPVAPVVPAPPPVPAAPVVPPPPDIPAAPVVPAPPIFPAPPEQPAMISAARTRIRTRPRGVGILRGCRRAMRRARIPLIAISAG